MIVGLVLIMAAFIVYFDFIQPAYSDVQAIKAEQLSLDNFLTNEKQAISKVQDLINTYQGQGALQAAVSSVFPQKEDMVGALAQLYGLAQNSGLNLQSVSSIGGGAALKPTSGGINSSDSFIKPIGNSVIQLKLAGPYEDLKVFLARLETNMRIFDVKSLTIQPSVVPGGRSGQISYTYDVSVATYYQGQ